MIFNPSFLPEEDLISFKKDTCIFCNSKFNTKLTVDTGTERRGDHYTEHHVDVLYKKYLISDLDVYSFDFKFDEESEHYLNLKKTETVEKIKSKKLKEAPRLRKKLESKFSPVKISKDQKEIAINAIVEDYLSELNPMFAFGKSELEDRIDGLFHNLKLGDLSLVFRNGFSSDYSEKSDDPKFNVIRHYCKPAGLKTHKKCWPFEDFNDSASFSVGYAQFFNDIIKNPLFKKYEFLFKKFPDLWKDILEKTKVVINAKTYNPVDYIN